MENIYSVKLTAAQKGKVTNITKTASLIYIGPLRFEPKTVGIIMAKICKKQGD